MKTQLLKKLVLAGMLSTGAIGFAQTAASTDTTTPSTASKTSATDTTTTSTEANKEKTDTGLMKTPPTLDLQRGTGGSSTTGTSDSMTMDPGTPTTGIPDQAATKKHHKHVHKTQTTIEDSSSGTGGAGGDVTPSTALPSTSDTNKANDSQTEHTNTDSNTKSK